MKSKNAFKKNDFVLKLRKLLIFVLLNLSTFNAFPTYSSRNGISSSVIITITFFSPIFSKEYTSENYTLANEVAKEKCYKYADYRYNNRTIPGPLIGDPVVYRTDLECPRTEPLVFHGKKAIENEFSHMVLLFYDEVIDNNGPLCGGTLISEKYILSAAHCSIPNGKSVKWAGLGLLSRQQYIEDTSKKNLFEITSYYIYQDETKNLNHDIALFELKDEIPLSPSIRPICIQNEQLRTGDIATVTGWGWTEEGQTADWLMKTDIHYRNASDCALYYKDNPSFVNGFDQENMICGGHLTQPKDTCQGDSGGPMQVRKDRMDCMWVQVGITSTGAIRCGETKQTVYTKVSYYLPWIVENVWSL